MNPSTQSIIAHVLQKKSIVEYLSKRGVEPVKRLNGGRYVYLCPLPDHRDTNASFYVWAENGEYENYFCFGCQSHYNIIHLVAGMESLSFKESLQKLSDGMKFTIDDDIELLRARMDKDWRVRQDAFKYPDMMISISALCMAYLNFSGNDAGELAVIEKFYSKIDHFMLQGEVHEIEDIYALLPKFLAARKKKFKEKKREQMRREINGG